MILPVRFSVLGLPIPQGSMRTYNGKIVHDSAPALKAWRGRIAWKAKEEGCRADESAAFSVVLMFTLPRPESVVREFPTVRPDLDKLVRACLDALTGIVYRDDSQVIEIYTAKKYGRVSGVEIEIGRKV